MSDNDTTTATGHIAENLAARFLEKRGLAVKTRNYRCRGGEIDLVCRDGNALVFVEVRLRRNSGFGGAGATPSPRPRIPPQTIPRLMMIRHPNLFPWR